MNPKHTTGFTLIELLIVLVIAAILTIAAWPSYQNFTRKTRLESARADLMATAQMLERFYSLHRTFCPTATVPNCVGFPGSNTFVTEKSRHFFTLSYAARMPSANDYTLVATPLADSGETRVLRYNSTSSMMLCEPSSNSCIPY